MDGESVSSEAAETDTKLPAAAPTANPTAANPAAIARETPACQPRFTADNYPRNMCGVVSDGCTDSLELNCDYGSCHTGACNCVAVPFFDGRLCGVENGDPLRVFTCSDGSQPDPKCKPAAGAVGLWCCP
jgi:hypothetical protein